MSESLNTLGIWLGGDGTWSSTFPLLMVHLNIVIYALCFWMQQPVLPFLSKELGVDGQGFGMLQSFVSAFALIGGPVIGRLTDQFGPKLTLIISQAGSVAMYSLLSIATSAPLLFASRVPSIAQHAMLASQAAVSVLSSTDKRSSALGKLSLSYGIGMVLGSPLGGTISEHVGYRYAAMISTVFSVLILVLDALFFPEMKAKSETIDKKEDGLNLSKIFELLLVASVRDLLLTTTAVFIGLGSFRTVFSLAAEPIYGLNSQDLGYFMSFGAIVGLVTNVFLVARLISFFGSNINALVGAAFCLSICYVGYSFTSTYSEIMAVSIPVGIFSTLLYTVSGALMSLVVEKGDAGTAIALSHASRSFTGIVSPIIGGKVFDEFGIDGACWFAAGCCMIAAAFASIVSRSISKENITSSSSEKKQL
uniref:Major facilitator superfamily (MFS) profile domain-containing protein n=1 Tax=Aplanochytrium stocchinoi TaxID=215587 RepID=A0A7S3PFX6_9STRA